METKRTKRQHNSREDVVAESRWAPFLPTDRAAPLLVVREAPALEAAEVPVTSSSGRRYPIALKNLLANYHRVEGEVVAVAHDPRPAVRVEPLTDAAAPALTAPPDHAATPAPAGALVPRAVDGWPLWDGAGGTWVRDVDLAERAGLEVPRDVRRTIATAIKDNLINIFDVVGTAHDALAGAPVVRVHEELVPVGTTGGQKPVTVYYLNEEGALLVVTRLRTPKAIEATKAIVRVFAMAMRGELATAPAGSSMTEAKLDRLLETLAALPGKMLETVPAIVAAAVHGSLAALHSAKPQTVAAPARPDAAEGAPGVPYQPATDAAAPAPAAPPKPAAAPRPPTVLIPRDWRSSDVLAALLSERRGHRVSRRKVDGAITELKLRDRPELARHGMTSRTDGGGVHYEVPFWRYAPCVLDTIDAHLFGPHPQQSLRGV